MTRHHSNSSMASSSVATDEITVAFFLNDCRAFADGVENYRVFIERIPNAYHGVNCEMYPSPFIFLLY